MEYVVQRYVVSPQGKAAKVRINWGIKRGFSLKRLIRKTAYPFNSSLGIVTKPKAHTRMNSVAMLDTSQRKKLRTSQQLRFPVKPPTPFSHRRTHSSFSHLATSVLFRADPYTVSCESLLDAEEDHSTSPGLEPFVRKTIKALQTAKLLQGLTVTALQFDVMQGTDGQWYFLDMKEMSTELIEERVEQRLGTLGWQHEEQTEGKPLSRTLAKLQAFFQSNQSLIRHKAPFVPRAERYSQISFYFQ